MKIGFTAGAMDLLHPGHLMMLRECKDRCDWLIVGLHTDPTIDRPKKNKPVETVWERWLRLQSCGLVDEIIPYETEEDLTNLLRYLRPDVRFVGADHIGKDFTGKELDIPVSYNSRDHNYSTTNLRRRICARKRL